MAVLRIYDKDGQPVAELNTAEQPRGWWLSVRGKAHAEVAVRTPKGTR